MKDENQYVDAHGVRWVAEPETLGCDGCAFDFALTENCGDPNRPRCMNNKRIDKRSIIWIRSD